MTTVGSINWRTALGSRTATSGHLRPRTLTVPVVTLRCASERPTSASSLTSPCSFSPDAADGVSSQAAAWQATATDAAAAAAEAAAAAAAAAAAKGSAGEVESSECCARRTAPYVGRTS